MFIVQPYWKCPWDVHNFFLLSGSIFELNPADTVHHRMKQCELSNHHVTMFSPLVITDYVPFPCSLSWFLYFRFSSATMSLLIWHVPVPLMPCHCSVWRSGMEQKKLLKNILWLIFLIFSFFLDVITKVSTTSAHIPSALTWLCPAAPWYTSDLYIYPEVPALIQAVKPQGWGGLLAEEI